MSGGEERVPKGYKQTEVGVIPDDWGLKTFGEIFDFKSTASNSRSDLTESDSTHYIHYGDIHTVFHRHLNLEKRDTPMISRELCKNAALVRNGDWVMADASEDYSGICKAIEISGIANESSVVAGLHTFLLRDREGTYVPGFKGHLGEAKYLHDQYVRVSVGLKVFGVTKRSLRDLFIPVPPKQEQSRIEEILTDSDSQIQVLENLIAKKRDIKQGTMQELLTGKTRLPGFSGEWETITLKDLVNLMPSGIYGFETNNSDLIEMPVATTAHISMKDKWNQKKMKNRFFTTQQLHNYTPKLGDIVVVKSSGSAASIQSGKMAFVDSDTAGKFIFSNFLMLLRPIECDTKFLFYQLTSSRVKMMIPFLVESSTYPNIRIEDYMDIEVPLPNNSEQKAIAEVISDMDAEIAVLEQRLEKTKAIKQGMMQQLLTGWIRLVDPSTPVEASA